MKKVFVIISILLLIGLCGNQGCAPPSMQRFTGKQAEIVMLRGLSVEFEKGMPNLRSKEGEKSLVLRADGGLEVGLEIKNYLLRPRRVTITVSELGEYSSLIGRESQTFNVGEAVVQDDKLYPGESLEPIYFGPYDYYIEKIGKGVDKISLITEVESVYYANLNSDLCFTRDIEHIVGVICNNDETLTENMLKGDAGYLPVSIDKIIKYVKIRENGATFDLFIKLRNFNDGLINIREGDKTKTQKINDFSATLKGSGDIKCGREAVFRDGIATDIKCEGRVDFGEELFTKLPVDFEFSYEYKIITTLNYKVI